PGRQSIVPSGIRCVKRRAGQETAYTLTFDKRIEMIPREPPASARAVIRPAPSVAPTASRGQTTTDGKVTSRCPNLPVRPNDARPTGMDVPVLPDLSDLNHGHLGGAPELRSGPSGGSPVGPGPPRPDSPPRWRSAGSPWPRWRPLPPTPSRPADSICPLPRWPPPDSSPPGA